MTRLLLFLIFSLGPIFSFAQCPGCIVNTACTAVPTTPALCPETLPEAIQGEPYEIDVTFFMPQQFTDPGSGFDITLSSITIATVGGLPPGLSATTNEADNVYDITSDPLTQRGCVKICGTPTAIGFYTISVNIIASVSSPISTDQPQSFTLPIAVVPGGSGNAGFSLTPNSGCDSVNVAFQALITSPSQPVTYLWDFGNGQTSTAFTPEEQFYPAADTYYVSLQTNLLNYVVTGVTYTSTGDNWCGDAEEPPIPFVGGCFGSPDIYYELSNGGATFTGPTQDNNENYNQSDAFITLTETALSINFWDEDVISQNDALGTAVVQFNAPGVYSFNTGAGFGTVTIGTTVGISFVHNDTIIVHPSPNAPSILSGDLAVCDGDSIILSLPDAAFYQWYQDGIELLSANNDTLIVYQAGSYTADIRSVAGCLAVSDTVQTLFIEFPEEPTVFVNPVNNSFFYNPGSGYDWIWLFEGDTIAGTQNLSSFFPQEIGNYSVVVSADPTCALYSESEFFTNLGVEASPQFAFKLYPQPFQSGLLSIDSEWITTGMIQIQMLDLTGRVVYQNLVEASNGRLSFQVDQQAPGMYLINLQQGEKRSTQRLIISASGPGSN
jgi:hypothetical protein